MTTPKASVITKLKNIMSKTKRRFLGSSKAKLRDENVSAAEAVDIQRDVYLRSCNLKDKSYTPPYMELAAQLLADEEQIFKAAANHLASIAQARHKYSEPIKAIFAEVIANRRLSEEKLDYINKKLTEIQAR